MKKITAPIIAVLLTVFALPAFADEENYIKYRQYVMKSLSANLKASAMILKGKVEGNLKGHSAAIASAGTSIDNIFPEGSDFGETDASPKIWEQPEKFMQETENFKKASAAFNENPSIEIFGSLGKSCKSCHKAYREK